MISILLPVIIINLCTTFPDISSLCSLNLTSYIAMVCLSLLINVIRYSGKIMPSCCIYNLGPEQRPRNSLLSYLEEDNGTEGDIGRGVLLDETERPFLIIKCLIIIRRTAQETILLDEMDRPFLILINQSKRYKHVCPRYTC